MSESAPDKKGRSKAPAAEALLAAACHVNASEGLAGLALRPLAQALGVSTTVLTNHYGARADILAAICAAARARDALLFDGWRDMLAGLGQLPAPIAASLAETILEELAASRRPLSALYLEMLHASSWDDSLRTAFAGWTEERRAFWDAFGRQAGLPAPLLDSAWWHGYATAELAYSMALNDDTSYRLLRKLCLQRLFAGGAAHGEQAVDAALFAQLSQRTDHNCAARQAGGDTGSAPAWAAQAARACGIRLAARGVHGLTHRAVAADIGVPHTTLSYRFPTQHDLVLAGIDSIAAHILSAVDAGSLDELERRRTVGDGEKLDQARASFAVTLAALRMPGLAPHTARMRSRRGANLLKVFTQYLPDTPGIDALCAQVVSLGLTGLTNLEPPGASSRQTVATAFAATARWLARAG